MTLQCQAASFFYEKQHQLFANRRDLQGETKRMGDDHLPTWIEYAQALFVPVITIAGALIAWGLVRRHT